jgi:subtilase family serine protease
MFRNRLISLFLPLAVASAALLAPPHARADVVALEATPQDQTITTTIIFNVKHPGKLARYIRETVTPGGPHYRDFLSLQEFVVHYAPAPGQLRKVESYLESLGITVDKVFDNHLAITVTGPASAFNQVFNTQLENYKETEPSRHPYRRHHFHRPKSQPQIPSLLQENGVLTVVGLSNEYMSQPMHLSVSAVTSNVKPQAAALLNNTIATGQPQNFTVGDVANIYNVNPLYEEGIVGSGTTIGVATFANFVPSDAYTYWDNIGLTYKPNRITQVHVDGGAETGADVGTGETTLDVQQSGGLAPFANMIVYDAPNTDVAGIDMFYQIVSENRVDSLSYSWGLPEIFYYPEMNGGVDFTSDLQAENQAFMEAAVQGITLYAASGDSGAYDTNRTFPAPYFSTPLTADSPVASPYMTAAGGTTLPVRLLFGCPAAASGTYEIDVPHRRAWAWNYLESLFTTCYGESQAEAKAEVFAVGAGGGVSVYWPRPWYQYGTPGMQNSVAGQSFIQYLTPEQAGTFNVCGTSASAPPYDCLDLIAGFAGRNVPDISMNADPETGYRVYCTVCGFSGNVQTGYGGTSFVAPQLNGITGLINQRVHGRVGLMNAQLYRLLREFGYGTDSPFGDITHGDNWYWPGVAGYDQATGVGIPNVARLAEVLAGHHHGH